MIPSNIINPCKEIVIDTEWSSEFCQIGTGSREPKNDPKRKGKRKLSNLDDEQYEWVKSQSPLFTGRDGEIYSPDYGISFFGRDIWVSEKMCEWFILHYGTVEIQSDHAETMRRMYSYLSKALADEVDKQIVETMTKTYYETESKSK